MLERKVLMPVIDFTSIGACRLKVGLSIVGKKIDSLGIKHVLLVCAEVLLNKYSVEL